MLTALLGVLYPRLVPPAPTGPDFAPTAMLESPARALDTRGRGEAGPAQDLLVRGTTADAICRPLLPPGPDGSALRRITLFDPGRRWGRAMVKLLADASGEPLERIYLRRHDTLSTLSLVERTALPRRIAEPLQLTHVELRSPTLRATSVPLALLGRSHLAVVVLAPMAPAALDELLALVFEAVRRSDWCCPNLLFLGAGADAATEARVRGIHWPGHLNVEFAPEPIGSASAAWNAVLRGWNRLKLLPQRLVPTLPPRAAPLPPGTWAKAGSAGSTGSTGSAPRPRPALPAAAHARLDPAAMQRALDNLAGLRGVLGAAVADSTTGLVLGRRFARCPRTPDLDEAALTLSEVLKAHRRATLDHARRQGIEEVLVTQPTHHQVLRTLSAQPHLFLFVVLDRTQSNLALARHAVSQAEKGLG